MLSLDTAVQQQKCQIMPGIPRLNTGYGKLYQSGFGFGAGKLERNCLGIGTLSMSLVTMTLKALSPVHNGA